MGGEREEGKKTHIIYDASTTNFLGPVIKKGGGGGDVRKKTETSAS